MFTAPSTLTRVLFVLCCTTQLLVWSGCSRMMSPPGQRLFGRNNQPANDPYDWNATTDQEPAPYAADSMHSDQNLGNQGIAPQSRAEALQTQFAQSYQVPERVPPRLIPIESVEFPGSEAAEVVTASARISDQRSTREALAVGFSDDSIETNKNVKEVKQAILFSDQPAIAAKAVSPTLPEQQTVSLPARPAQTKLQTAETAPPSLVSNTKAATSQEPKSSNTQGTEPATSSPIANSFKPDEFQASRRATKTESKETSPSDLNASQINPAFVTKNPPQKNPPLVDTEVNPNRLALDAKSPISPANPSKAVASDNPKIVLPDVEKTLNLQTAQPAVAEVAKATASPAKKPDAKATSGVSSLTAAGIKVDKTAFEKLIPEKKKTEPLKTIAKMQPARAEAQSTAKLELASGASTRLASKPPALQVTASVADETCTTQSCESAASTIKQSNDFSATLPPKMAGVDSNKTLPTALSERPSNPTTAAPAPKSSLFQPASSAAITASTTAQSTSFTPPPTNPISSSSVSKISATTSQGSEPRPLPRSAKTPLDLNSVPPTIKPKTVSQAKQNLSELNLLDRNFPKSTAPGKNPGAPPPTNSKPISNSAALIPSQFTASPPQPTAHLEKPVEVPALKLVNSQFCTEIKGFGQVTPFPSTRFKSNQRTLVYCEVENYQSQMRSNDKGTEFTTRFQGRYQIVDTKGNVVQSGQFPEIKDVTVRKRKDFYLYFPITLKDLRPNEYRLKLTIEESTPTKVAASDSLHMAEQAIPFIVE